MKKTDDTEAVAKQWAREAQQWVNAGAFACGLLTLLAGVVYHELTTLHAVALAGMGGALLACSIVHIVLSARAPAEEDDDVED